MWVFIYISWSTTTAQIIFICFWRDILRQDDAIFPNTLRPVFLYMYLTMRDTFEAAFLPTTWLVSELGLTMEMTKQPYGITVAAKSQKTTYN